MEKFVRPPRGKSKIHNSFGVYDAYKLLSKSKWLNIGKPVTSKDFYAIVRKVNKLLADEIANGRDAQFPSGMGKIELTKVKPGAHLFDGRVHVTYPVDWKETIDLWNRDEEARKNKVRVRRENKFTYRTRYNRHNCKYGNNRLYKFKLNRFVKIALKENINKGIIDALW